MKDLAAAPAKLFGSGPVARSAAHPIRSFFAALILFWAVVTLLQRIGGAYLADFTGYPDEPAHYVTSLMIRDYLVSGDLAHPVHFAENYYLHYPKVAFGMWGPLLHTAAGTWMLLFSASRISAMLFMGLITALLAATTWSILRKFFSPEAAACGCLALVMLPIVQQYTGMMMADTLVALMDLWAALSFYRFLESGRTRDAILFGMFATLSILTKGNGVAIILLPPLAIVFTRRWDVLKARAFWYAAGIILFVAGPWQYYSITRLGPILNDRTVNWKGAGFYFSQTALLFGAALLPAILLGVWFRLLRPDSAAKKSDLWAVAAAMIVAVVVFHALIPSASLELRYLIAIAPPLAWFLIAGLNDLGARVRLPGISARGRTAILLLVVAILFATEKFEVPHSVYRGYSEVARALYRPDNRNAAILISSVAGGEGSLVAEIAMRDHRDPGQYVLRASKVLSQSDWEGRRYRLLTPSPEDVMKYLKSVPVKFVVLDRAVSQSETQDHQLLSEAIGKFPEEFRLLGRYPVDSPEAPPVDVYRVVGTNDEAPGHIRIELPFTLGRAIEK